MPSIYETYGMTAIEAAGYGIPTVHVDTPHVREGIGEGAVLVKGLDVDALAKGIRTIEDNYDLYSENARKRAEWLYARQKIEAQRFREFIESAKPLDNKELRQRQRLMGVTRRRNRAMR